jgi:predicted DNA-binding transcriptional regulator AlpA
MVKHTQKPITPQTLTKLVGYAEIEAAYGIKRRTLERMQDDGRFPRAVQISPNRRAWPLSVVEAWFEQRSRSLSNMAVIQPDDLRPDQIGDAIAKLGARLASTAAGRKIEPSEILGVTVRPTPDQIQTAVDDAAHRSQLIQERLIDALKGLHIAEAFVLVRAFLPPLAKLAEGSLERLTGKSFKLTGSQWREVAMFIINDLLDGEITPPATHPRDVFEAMADDGVLSRLK